MTTIKSAIFQLRRFSPTRLLPFCFLLMACSGRLQLTPTPIAQITIYPTATPLSLSTATATRPRSPTPQSTTSPTARSQPTATPEPPTATPVTGPAEGVVYHLLE